MISVDEAQSTIARAITPTQTETVGLETAAGRRLAAPLLANLTQPPFDASAMDGYACRAVDARNGGPLSVIGVSAAGDRFNGALRAGQAVRIFTGAPLPDGADCVVIQENATRNGDEITADAPSAAPGDHIRKAGIDFNKGEELLAPGTQLTGPALALAAAANADNVTVRRAPRVALIANGDELVMPGSTPSQDQIICSVPFALEPMFRDWGADPRFLGVAPDEPAAIRRVAEQALDYDLIVPIGGASVGEKDFMRRVFAELKFETLFEKVAVKPGKPTWFAAGTKAHVLGLPGNPASALVTSILFGRTAIDAFLGAPTSIQSRLGEATLTEPLAQNGPRETFLRGAVAARHGETVAAPLKAQDSSLLSVFARSNALLRRKAHAPSAAAGDRIEYLAM